MMKIKISQLRKIIREEVQRSNWLEKDTGPSLEAKNGKLEVTVGNKMFDFTPDNLKAAMSKPRWSINSDDYDDDEETGATIMRASKGEDPTIAVFDNEKRIGGGTIAFKELVAAMQEL